MVHLLLKYPNIITNLSFIHISTLPLEFRAGSEKNNNLDTIQQSRNNRDGNQVNIFNVIENSARTDNFLAARVRNKINDLATWRMHTNSEKLTFESVEASQLSIDKVSKFSLRPCEFRKAFPQIREFYCFHEYVGRLTEEKMKNYICSNINSSYFIDGIMNNIKVREEALPEVMAYLDNKIGIKTLYIPSNVLKKLALK